jgi:putative two-component system response regulator
MPNELRQSAGDASPGNEDERRLAAIAELLARQLSAPDDESMVRVAAAHTELRQLAAMTSPRRARCLLDVAQFFYISGQTILGLEPAANAVAAARSLGDSALLRRALSLHGILLTDSGNLPAAVECFAEAIEIAQRTDDRAGEGAVWINVSAALLQAAQYLESVRASQRALELAQQAPALAPMRSRALTNIALASLYSQDFAAGLEAARASVEGAPEPVSADELLARVNAESNYAWLLLEVDDLTEALRRCELAKNYAAQSCSQRAEQVAAITEGFCEVHAGKVDIGLSRLQAALDRARILKSTWRDALIAMVKAQELCGNPQLALVHLRELLQVTRRSQQEKALLHHRMHLQELGYKPPSTEAAALAAASRAALDRDMVRAQLALLHRQAIAAELIEDPSGHHIFRVGKLAALLAAEVGLDSDTCFMIEMSARLHDIGKIGIPVALFARRGTIKPEQRSLVRSHANIGAELLSQSGLPHIQMAIDVARHHHERWDGTGYPDGLAGGAIPDAARITTLADVFDVLTHDRPNRPAGSRQQALAEIRRLAGSRFDPALVEAFVPLVERLAAEVGDLDAFLAEEAQESSFLRSREKIARALDAGVGAGPAPPG